MEADGCAVVVTVSPAPVTPSAPPCEEEGAAVAVAAEGSSAAQASASAWAARNASWPPFVYGFGVQGVKGVGARGGGFWFGCVAGLQNKGADLIQVRAQTVALHRRRANNFWKPDDPVPTRTGAHRHEVGEPRPRRLLNDVVGADPLRQLQRLLERLRARRGRGQLLHPLVDGAVVGKVVDAEGLRHGRVGRGCSSAATTAPGPAATVL